MTYSLRASSKWPNFINASSLSAAGSPGGIAFAKTIKADDQSILFASSIAQAGQKARGFSKKILKVSFINTYVSMIFRKFISSTLFVLPVSENAETQFIGNIIYGENRNETATKIF